MVTHGYVTFKYKGIYYVYNNHSDSYCEGLGQKVVENVKYMIKKNYIKQYKAQLLRVPLTTQMTDGDEYYHSIYDAIYNYNSCMYYTSNIKESNEYVYMIDFDENEFVVNSYNNSATFHLFDIPDNWIEILNETKNYMYENKEAIKREIIKKQILEMEDEINQLKLQLN
jgi:hypothetical protein